MKKLISIALIFSIAAPFWISYSVIQIEKYYVKKEIKKFLETGLKESEMTMLKFSKKNINKEIKWFHSKEFEFNENMYDVIKSEETSDSIFFWCWLDNEETQLNLKLNKMADNALNSNGKTTASERQLQRIINSYYYLESNPFNLFYKSKEKQFYKNYTLTLLSIKIKPPTPPPQNNFIFTS